MSWEIGWWRSEKDRRRNIEYRLEQQRKREEAERNREQFTKIAFALIAAIAAASLVLLI